jgi:hypothetical protein
MRWTLGLLLLGGGCKETTAGACRNYITSYNECAREQGDSVIIGGVLVADVYCAAYALPGVPKDPELADGFNCLADAYDAADCSSDEAFAETFDATCEDAPEE